MIIAAVFLLASQKTFAKLSEMAVSFVAVFSFFIADAILYALRLARLLLELSQTFIINI